MTVQNLPSEVFVMHGYFVSLFGREKRRGIRGAEEEIKGGVGKEGGRVCGPFLEMIL